MASKGGHEHGQPPVARYDPCFTSPLSASLGASLLAAGICAAVLGAGAPLLLLGALALALPGLMLLAVACSPALRLRLRTGSWPLAAPATLQEIQQALAVPQPPVAVGEGWGFFIARAKPAPGAIALRGKWAGEVAWESGAVVRVRSGTLFGELVRILWEKGRAAVDRPQFDQLSVGAAVRTCGHGWFAGGWFIDSVVALSGVERGTGRLVEARRGDAEFWKVALGEEFVVTEVALTSMPDRLMRVRQAVERVDRKGAQMLPDGSEWLASPFKLMFVSGNQVLRKWGTYLAKDEEEVSEEVRITGCDFRCRTIRRHLRMPEEFDLVDSVADGHTLIQTIWPLESVVERLAGTLNVELFVDQSIDWEAAIQPLARYHAEHGGRTELRERTLNGVTVTAFDVIAPVGTGIMSCCSSKKEGFLPWFQMLSADFGISSGSLHTGKFLPSTGGPVRLLPPVDFWPQVSQKALVPS